MLKTMGILLSCTYDLFPPPQGGQGNVGDLTKDFCPGASCSKQDYR